MIARHLKIKLNSKHRKILDKHLWHLTGVYNWAIKAVELRKEAGLPYSEFDLSKLSSSHSKRIGVSSRAIQGTIHQAFFAWKRCWSKQNRAPKFKSARNKLNSILLRGDCKLSQDYIKIPGIGKLRYKKFDLPVAEVAASVTLIKKPSGWYAVVLFKTDHTRKLEESQEKVGVDTGFKHLAILSNGEKFKHPRELESSLNQLARNQRGTRRKKTAKLHEKISNQRKDRNHKISAELVKRFSEIYITNDNLRGISRKFGRSVNSSGIGQLRNFISYKSSSCGRKCVLVDSKNTTVSCSNCRSLTGPKGLNNLNVRNWVCEACGASHDRDVNAAINVLNFGLRYSLESLENVAKLA